MIGPRVMVAFAENLSTRCTAAGIRPARAGNFLLSRQKKVTKEEALNRTLPEACDGRRAKTPVWLAHRSEPLRSRCCPCNERDASTVRASNVGCTPNSRAGIQAPLGRRVSAYGAFSGEPGVQPALTGVKARWMVLGIGTAARAQRVASGHRPSARFRARAVAAAHRRAVSASLLVTFLWQDREKLPARRGGLPARCTELQRLSAKAPMTSPRPA